MKNTTDIRFMHRALELAEKGWGKTSPNPMVGAVVVKRGQVVGEGYHRKAGDDHAEVVALKKARGEARGATVYVSLEPCCHTGRTGPCTKALIDASVKRVVYALKDPNPTVSGKGGRCLRKAGISVTANVLRNEATRLNEIYIHNQRYGRPFITLKLAQTLDGRIATSTGDSHWISGPQSRRMVHHLRAGADAVVVGMGTVRTDNPALTVREVRGNDPYRVVLSSSAGMPPQSQLFSNNRDFKTILATTERALRRHTSGQKSNNLIYWSIKSNGRGRLDLFDFVRQAADFGITSILVEGGSLLATSFIKAGLVDKYIVFVAPKLVGSGINAIGELAIRRLSDAIEFEQSSFDTVGDDLVFSGYPRRKK
jgi:diaminohydroxyphosphoribosylaminopyrimidine deaminase/5-amino-6-(5-phosphoribosylamino)uracil reductase